MHLQRAITRMLTTYTMSPAGCVDDPASRAFLRFGFRVDSPIRRPKKKSPESFRTQGFDIHFVRANALPTDPGRQLSLLVAALPRFSTPVGRRLRHECAVAHVSSDAVKDMQSLRDPLLKWNTFHPRNCRRNVSYTDPSTVSNSASMS